MTLGEELTAFLLEKRPNLAEDLEATNEVLVALGTLHGCVVAGGIALEMTRMLTKDTKAKTDAMAQARIEAANGLVTRTVARTLLDMGEKLRTSEKRITH